jgi:hypothetical protein
MIDLERADTPTPETTEHQKTDLFGLTLPELVDWLAARGQPAFRARQLTG